jgi:hypothetical protein
MYGDRRYLNVLQYVPGILEFAARPFRPIVPGGGIKQHGPAPHPFVAFSLDSAAITKFL